MGIVGSIIEAIGSNRQNRMNMEFTRQQNEINYQRDLEAYQTQRKDAIADRDYQNAYNSPAQQMQRLKEAGINPHMAYAKGGVENQGGMARASTMPRSNAPAPFMANNPGAAFNKGDLSSDFASIIGIQQGKENVKKTAAETELLNMERVTKALSQIDQMLEIDIKGLSKEEQEFRVKNLQKMQDEIIKNYTANRGLLEAQTKGTIDANAREAELQPYKVAAMRMSNAKTLQEIRAIGKQMGRIAIQNAQSEQEIAQIKQRMQSETYNQEMIQLQTELKKRGLDGSDPMYIKTMVINITRGVNAALEYLNAWTK